MNRAERIYRLHGMLQGRRPVALAQITHALEVSRATAKRDIAYLRDFFQAPLVYEREHNGYRYAPDDNDFELPGLWFNESELFALLAADELLESVQPGLLGRHLGPLKARVRRLLAYSGHRAETVSQRIRVRQATARAAAHETFAAVAKAVLQARVLTFRYHGRLRDTTSNRRVHPARLVHYRGGWYLFAWCEQARALRLFALERISEPCEPGAVSQQLDEPLVERQLNASFGIFTGAAADWAVLRFSPEMAKWVADEQWHPDQIGQWRGGAYELQVPYSDPRELLLEILKYGAEVEVAAPRSLRDRTRERLRGALAQYETGSHAAGEDWLNE